LPVNTQAMLIRHYEQVGGLPRPRTLFRCLLKAGKHRRLDFGISFYQRLQGRSDEALLSGNLPDRA
jgi:hypothetical protein